MVKRIVLKGSPLEIGKQYGEELRSQIHQVLDIYINNFWSIKRSDLESAVAGFQKATRKYSPQIDQEIQGIALASNIPVHEVYAINARTELLSMSSKNLIECTAVGIRSHMKLGNDAVLAQNWDWCNLLRGLTCVVEYHLESPYYLNPKKLMVVVEPGMVGKIGMNNKGFGVCINYLPSTKVNPDGVPVHILSRLLNECSCANSASFIARFLPRASSINLLIGDSNNFILNLETTPDEVKIIKDDDFIVHTNSYSSKGETCSRQRRFEQALADCVYDHESITPEALKKAFRARGVEFPVMRFPGGTETIHSIIMNLSEKRMLVSDGALDDLYSIFYFR